MPHQNPAFEAAVNYAAEHGILMIAPVGNEDDARINFPAGFENVIGVGAVDRHGNRWSEVIETPYGNFPRGSNYNETVFITAPGAALHILSLGGASGVRITSATSYAAPKITALAAIAMGHDPYMHILEFEQLLINSSIPRGDREWDPEFGHGIIDVGMFMYNLTRRDFFDFLDAQNHWARTHIWENARYGLMHGRVQHYFRGTNHGSHRFYQPSAPMWRLEMTMALGRLHQLNGGAIPWQHSDFNDVNNSGYFPYNYYRFVNWAYENDIVQGIGSNLFSPGSPVTREAAAVFFFRYTEFLLGREFATPADPRAILRSRFPEDYYQVSSWAERELAWAIWVGLIYGRATPQGLRLAPRESITRAEGATFLSRYRQSFMRDTFTLSRDGWDRTINPAGWVTLDFNLGGTESNPTYPIAMEPTPVLVANNISYFLSWYQGGILNEGPTRYEYDFTGWYLDPAFTIPLTEDTIVPNTPFTLYASWGGALNLPPVNLGSLGRAMAQAESHEEQYYTPESWENLQYALNAARTVIANVHIITQQQVNMATDNLLAAIEALEFSYIGQPPVYLGYILAAIAEAESREEQNYTPGSWRVMRFRLAIARMHLEDPDSTQRDIDSGTRDLLSALAALVPSNNQPIHTGSVGTGQTTADWRIYPDGTLQVDGGAITWRGGNSPWLPYSPYITTIVFSQPIEAGPQISSLFRGLESVETIEGLENINTANVTNMTAMFLGTSNLTRVDGISYWDTSNVTRMDFMFSGATSLVYADLSNWATGNVTTMDRMFLNASALESLDLSNWDTGNVTDMSQMFRGASSLQCVGGLANGSGLSNWNVSNVRYMFSMFYNTNSLESLNLSNWETGKVTSMNNMFRNSGISTLGDISRWDTGSVTNMSSMFHGADNLTILDLSNWNTSAVTNMAFMFSDTSNLASIGDLSTWDTGNVTNMERMFRNASAVTNLSMSGWDMSAVSNTFQMLSGTSSLHILTLGEQFRANIAGSTALPAAPNHGIYTGRWQNIGPGTIDNPLGEYILTSAELMDMYSNGNIADTWIWHR